MKRLSKRKVITYFVALVVAAWSIAPILWTFVMSISYEREIFSVPTHWIPEQPTSYNYARIFGLAYEATTVVSGQAVQIRQGLVNSLLIATPVAVVATLLASLAGYAFGRYTFRFKNATLFAFLSTRMLPPITIIIPYYFVFSQIRLVGTYQSLIITYVAAIVPVLTWILLGFFATLPIEIERAARVDGCSRLRALRTVILPMAAPGIAAVGILAFCLSWNEFLFALILSGGTSVETLPPVISGLFTHAAQYTLMSAAVILSIIPTVVLSLIFQKYITQLRIVDAVSVRAE